VEVIAVSLNLWVQKFKNLAAKIYVYAENFLVHISSHFGIFGIQKC